MCVHVPVCASTPMHLCMSADENAVRHACLIAILFTWSSMTANYTTANLSACLTAWQMELLVPHFNQSHLQALWCALPKEAEVLSYIIRKPRTRKTWRQETDFLVSHNVIIAHTHLS